MSSIKNGYYEICEKIGLGISSLGESSKSCRENGEWVKKANNSNIKVSEEFCLSFNMRQPDGNPLRGEDAVMAVTIMKKAILEEDDELYNSLKEAGFINN
jgi:hypothetical protein